MKPLLLSAITGQFSDWRYYEIIMKVKNIVEIMRYEEQEGKAVPVYRVKTYEEVEEIYTLKGVNFMLQRVFDSNRLEPIKSFLLKQDDKYINNLTVAIFGGKPEWLPIGIKPILKDDDIIYEEEEVEEIAKNLGIIKLSGEETLFVLDGQHRVKGLREAVKEDTSLGEQEIAITLISHDNSEEGRKRTRRLFTTINRYAKPVQLGESILLDEDDLSAILTRYLIENYKYFKNKDIIAQNKKPNLPPSDFARKLTTTINLWNINEIFIDNEKVYPKFGGGKNEIVRVRPSDDIIEYYKKTIEGFWDTFFKTFPNVKEFVDGNISIGLERKVGGFYYMRPIGIEAIALLYKYLCDINKIDQFANIIKIEGKINSDFWNYVFWNPYKQNVKDSSKNYVKTYLFYHFGIKLTDSELKTLKRQYKKNSGDLQLELPPSIKCIAY